MVGETGTRVTRPNQHIGKQLQRGWKDSNGREGEEREMTANSWGSESIHNKQGKDKNQPDGADTEKNSKSSVVWKSKEVKWWERSAANSTESLETSTETQPLNLTWRSYLWLQKCHLYKRGIRRQTGRLSKSREDKASRGAHTGHTF